MLFLSKLKEDRSGIVQEIFFGQCLSPAPSLVLRTSGDDRCLHTSFLWILKLNCFSVKT